MAECDVTRVHAVAMGTKWTPRCEPATDLVRPVPVDPTGRSGPTVGQARGPRWRRTSPRFYVPSSVDRGLVEQRILEESLRLPRGGVVTGWAALRLAGGGIFDGLSADGRTLLDVPLLLPPGIDIRRGPGYQVRRERLEAEETTVLCGVPCTRPLRAVFDEARRRRDARGAVEAIDMTLAAGLVGDAALRTFVMGKAGWPGSRLVAAALPLVDGRSRSPRETALRLVWMLDAGLPRPLCNWPVADASGRPIGTPDLLCEELAVVVEFDGADHRSRSRHRVDVRREDLFRRAGLEHVAFVGADLDDTDLVVDRLHAAVDRARRSGVPRTWRRKRDPAPWR